MIAQVKNKVKDFVITLEIRGKKHYHIVKVCEMKNYNLSKETRADLSRAYMGVYKAFVNAYQSRGIARAQSQFNAICVMREIMMSHTDTKDNPAIRFLTDLYNTHYKIVSKKTMVSPNKDKIEPITADDGGRLLTAINDFENAIVAATTPNVLCVFKKIKNTSVTTQKKTKQNFSSWLDNSANDADITKMQNDPTYFGKLYRRYVMRQSHR